MAGELRGLSLTQPWASLVAVGAKRIETRDWGTAYRGPIAIHATKRFPVLCRDLCDDEPFRSALARGGYLRRVVSYNQADSWVDVRSIPLGAIVAVAKLVGCFRVTRSTTYAGPAREGSWRVDLTVGGELDFGDYAPGRYAWVLASVRRLPQPVPCRGALGLWRVPADVVARIDARPRRP